ncbi:hypothetical protein [Scytonema hofmannii]|uniref:hypothetical protein n=1 Tax=Scytonema hofmannii TaxID=34078 RepID=UPI00034C31ED|nr:hypothetical protein [Scytonema hofmannii]
MKLIEKNSLFSDISAEESTVFNGGYGSYPTYEPRVVWDPRLGRYRIKMVLVLRWR